MIKGITRAEWFASLSAFEDLIASYLNMMLSAHQSLPAAVTAAASVYDPSSSALFWFEAAIAAVAATQGRCMTDWAEIGLGVGYMTDTFLEQIPPLDSRQDALTVASCAPLRLLWQFMRETTSFIATATPNGRLACSAFASAAAAAAAANAAQSAVATASTKKKKNVTTVAEAPVAVSATAVAAVVLAEEETVDSNDMLVEAADSVVPVLPRAAPQPLTNAIALLSPTSLTIMLSVVQTCVASVDAATVLIGADLLACLLRLRPATHPLSWVPTVSSTGRATTAMSDSATDADHNALSLLISTVDASETVVEAIAACVPDLDIILLSAITVHCPAAHNNAGTAGSVAGAALLTVATALSALAAAGQVAWPRWLVPRRGQLTVPALGGVSRSLITSIEKPDEWQSHVLTLPQAPALAWMRERVRWPNADSPLLKALTTMSEQDTDETNASPIPASATAALKWMQTAAVSVPAPGLLLDLMATDAVARSWVTAAGVGVSAAIERANAMAADAVRQGLNSEGENTMLPVHSVRGELLRILTTGNHPVTADDNDAALSSIIARFIATRLIGPLSAVPHSRCYAGLTLDLLTALMLRTPSCAAVAFAAASGPTVLSHWANTTMATAVPAVQGDSTMITPALAAAAGLASADIESHVVGAAAAGLGLVAPVAAIPTVSLTSAATGVTGITGAVQVAVTETQLASALYSVLTQYTDCAVAISTAASVRGGLTTAHAAATTAELMRPLNHFIMLTAAAGDAKLNTALAHAYNAICDACALNALSPAPTPPFPRPNTTASNAGGDGAPAGAALALPRGLRRGLTVACSLAVARALTALTSRTQHIDVNEDMSPAHNEIVRVTLSGLSLILIHSLLVTTLGSMLSRIEDMKYASWGSTSASGVVSIAATQAWPVATAGAGVTAVPATAAPVARWGDSATGDTKGIADRRVALAQSAVAAAIAVAQSAFVGTAAWADV